MRSWAQRVPHEFQLIYGTPIPGYAAPPETIPAAAAVAAPFLRVGAVGSKAYEAVQLSDAMTEGLRGVPASGVAAVLGELAALVGFITLALSGHFVGTVVFVDDLYDGLLHRQVESLGPE